jgi:hypothetical protein
MIELAMRNMAHVRPRHDLAASFGQDCTAKLHEYLPDQNGIVLTG